MTFQTVTLVIDLADGTRTPLDRGSAMLEPSVQLTDVPDQFIAATAPVQAQFGTSYPPAFPQVQGLAATDNTGPEPSGWGWTVSFPGVPGSPASFSFFLPAGPAAFTATDASPCVFTWTPPGSEAWQLQSLPDGTGIRLSAAFGGFETGTTYYAVASSGYTFSLAATPGGAPLASTAAGSGQLTVVQYNLSALTPVQDVTAMQGYFPVPSGTPAAGDTILMSGSGYGSSFGPPGGGSGTVTSVSVASANGFAGTVANPTTTPAVTVETTVTGLLKGNGTGVSDAVAGTDYAPATTGTAILKGSGSGGFSSAASGTDYAPATSGTSLLKGSGAGGFSNAVAGTDYLAPAGNGSQLTGLTQAQISGLAAALAVLAPLASPAFTGTVTVPSTVNATDAAQKAYVDSVAQGLDAKPSVTALAASNITLSGTQTIDGVAVAAGNRVLCAGQSTASQNGIWVAASGSWTRPADFASGSSQLGAFAFVEGGTSYGSSGWVLTGTSAVTVDTSAETWTQFSGAGEITAGSGLSKSGNTLSLALTSVLVAAAGALLAANNLSDLANAATARTNLGLGSAATQASSAFDPAGAASTAQSNAEAYALPVAGGTMTGWLAPKVVTLTDAATVTLDAALGNDFRWTLAGNAHTLSAPSSPVDGQAITIDIQQPASGGPYTVTWTTTGTGCMDFGTDGAPVLSTAASAVDTVGFRYHAGLARWLCTGWKLGF